MSGTRVIAEYSDEPKLFEPPEHNGREVRDVQVNRVQNGIYFAGKRAASESTEKVQQPKTAK